MPKDKKLEAIFLRAYGAHTPNAIADLVRSGYYQAHWIDDRGLCRHACGRVADEHHPLRGWYDYCCPHCGQRVRTVFNPSAGGGITRYYGLTHPNQEIWVEVSRNSFASSGLQIDLVDPLGDWIADFHNSVSLLARMARLHTADYVRLRAGSYKMLVRVVARPMRTLVVVPVCLLPPSGTDLVEVIISWEQVSKFTIAPDDEVYVIPERKGNRYRVLARKPLEAFSR